MAEIEISVLETECLNRRIPDRYTIQKEVTAWKKTFKYLDTILSKKAVRGYRNESSDFIGGTDENCDLF